MVAGGVRASVGARLCPPLLPPTGRTPSGWRGRGAEGGSTYPSPNRPPRMNVHANSKDCRMAQTVIADDPLELVTREDEFSVGLDELGRIRISPTDVSQFIRLDQCERYLSLRH